MYARRVFPFLLMAGAAMMIMSHKRREFMGQCAEGEQPQPMGQHDPQFRHGPFGQRGEWAKRVPPMFEMWHKRAHEQEQAAQQPPAPAPAA